VVVESSIRKSFMKTMLGGVIYENNKLKWVLRPGGDCLMYESIAALMA
jgi:hypothetical protein